jgi:hypothetical protein
MRLKINMNMDLFYVRAQIILPGLAKDTHLVAEAGPPDRNRSRADNNHLIGHDRFAEIDDRARDVTFKRIFGMDSAKAISA